MEVTTPKGQNYHLTYSFGLKLSGARIPQYIVITLLCSLQLVEIRNIANDCNSSSDDEFCTH